MHMPRAFPRTAVLVASWLLAAAAVARAAPVTQYTGEIENFEHAKHLCEASYWRTAMTVIDVAKECTQTNRPPKCTELPVCTSDGKCVGGNHVDFQDPKDGKVFVATGDYPEMWIRDSAAQTWMYMNAEQGWIVKGLVRSQAYFIERNSYANAFNRDEREEQTDPNVFLDGLGRTGHIGTYNYEMDSGSYFFRTVYQCWKVLGELVPVQRAVWKTLETWKIEQEHDTKSKYRYKELPRNGLGPKVNESTGMSWTPYRPSDDPTRYGYHVPDNMWAVVTLGYVEEMATEWNDLPMLHTAKTLRAGIRRGLAEHATVDHPNFGKIYCYEIDGFGGCNQMDDANVPNLMSLPYLDPEHVAHDPVIYANTRRFILSDKNPYYFHGSVATGLGSQHTRHGYIWQMGLIMEGLTEPSHARKVELFNMILKTTTDFMHESFNPNSPGQFTRPWFTWPDTLFAEFCVDLGVFTGVPPRPTQMDKNKFHEEWAGADDSGARRPAPAVHAELDQKLQAAMADVARLRHEIESA